MDLKRLSWLHISDVHFKSGDGYDRDVVINALLKSIPRFRARGLIPDIIFFTGDVAFRGKLDEYRSATDFFEELLKQLGLSRDKIYLIPGNHDVDRIRGAGLKRTLLSQAEANDYFRGEAALLHLEQRQRAFLDWYDEFFAGVRSAARHTTCGPYEIREFTGFKLGILPINSAAFCIADDDAGKLWVGRRCLDDALKPEREAADLIVALMHHPLDWLHEIERTQIKSCLYANVDCVLRGHLHQTELERTDGTSGSAIHLAAGATYQGSEWPNKAMFVEVYEGYLRIVPIRFDDLPSPAWNIDTSMFPDSADFSGKAIWRREPPEDRGRQDGQSGEVATQHLPILEHTNLPAPIKDPEEVARRNFEQDLFVSPTGKLLYVEPRLSNVSQNAVTIHHDKIEFTNWRDIVQDSKSYIISVPSEYGGTSLAKRLALEFTRARIPADLRDTLDLPNYRAKLRNEFPSIARDGTQYRVLILDNYNVHRHEKLIKEIESLNIFSRFVVLTTARGASFDALTPMVGSQEAKVLFLWAMSRAGIREMAGLLIDSGDENYISALVEKVYGDLLALSIPLTPSNVVMYLKVLDKESDFHPFNRVDIVHKYLTGALSGASELLAGSFTSREKIDILSEFAYKLFSDSAGHFVEKDWFFFCESYMEDKLSAFSARDLLRDLEDSRVFVRHQERLYFKYSFFLSFLVGRHLANHPDMVVPFLNGPSRDALDGVIETVAALTGDGTAIMECITAYLEERLVEFSSLYVPFSFDPMAKSEWLPDSREEEMWETISQQIDRGPVSPSELDLIRGSFRREARTYDQEVRYSKLRELETEVFRAGFILGQALKASHGVQGSVKRRAIIASLRMYHIIMQIGVIQAPEIAKHQWFQWGGVLFIGFRRALDEGNDEQQDTMAIISSVPTAVVAKAVEDFGSRKLGQAFKTMLAEQEPESFLSLLLFACVIWTKPPQWEDCALERINKIGRRAFYLLEMLKILMKEYKTGVNTHYEREALKRLIATIHAKRSANKAVPGAKLVREVMRRLEMKGILRSGTGGPT